MSIKFRNQRQKLLFHLHVSPTLAKIFFLFFNVNSFFVNTILSENLKLG